MKKLVIKLLAMILCASFFCSSVSMAASELPIDDLVENRVAVTSSDGNLLEFEMYETADATMMAYYYNGVLKRTYNLTGSENQIVAAKANGESYTISKTHIAPIQVSTQNTDLIAEMNAVANTTQNLGVIYYNSTGPYTNSTNVISITNVDSEMGTHYINSTAGEYAADIAAAIASGIVAGLLGVVAAPATIAAAIAAAILSEMIASAGGDIVNEYITVSLSDSYDCVTLTKRLSAKFYGGAISGTWVQNYSCGVKYISYDGKSFSEHYPIGEFNQDNWTSTEFAIRAWKDTAEWHSGYSFPGVQRIIVNDPAN